MNRRRGVFDMVPISGWLFADLLLALSIIFLATMGGITRPPVAEAQPAAETPTPTATPVVSATETLTPTPTPTVTPTPRACQSTVLLKEQDFSILQRPNGGDPTTADIQKAFAPYSSAGNIVGLALIYGVASSPAEGNRLSKLVADQLYKTVAGEFQTLLPTLFTEDSLIKQLHDIQTDLRVQGEIDFQVFFFSTRC